MSWPYAELLARHYNLRETRAVAVEHGHTNETWLVDTTVGSFVLRRSWAGKPVDQIAREDLVLSALSTGPRARFPRVIPTLDGVSHVFVDGRSIRLFSRCGGEVGPRWLTPSRQAGARTAAATAVLVALHRDLADLPPLPGTEGHPWHWIAERLARVEALRVSRRCEGLPKGAERVLPRIASLLDVPMDGPVQWLHGDYHLGNLLWNDERVAAVVDFDEVGCGSATGELAMALFALARQDAGEDHFRWDRSIWLAGSHGGLEPRVELELLFCGYQVLIHLEAAQRGLWNLEPGIGFWPCWHHLMAE